MSAIYVIDDDVCIRDAIKMFLQSEGFVVNTFSSARDFFRTCSSGDTGCILTEVEIPGDITGLDFLANISKNAPKRPVIVMTGSGDGAFRRAAHALGACDYLEKPFSAERLIEAVSNATLPAAKAVAAE